MGTTTVTDPSSVNTESAGVEDAESSQGGKPAQPGPGKDLTAEEEALLVDGVPNYAARDRRYHVREATVELDDVVLEIYRRLLDVVAVPGDEFAAAVGAEADAVLE